MILFFSYLNFCYLVHKRPSKNKIHCQRFWQKRIKIKPLNINNIITYQWCYHYYTMHKRLNPLHLKQSSSWKGKTKKNQTRIHRHVEARCNFDYRAHFVQDSPNCLSMISCPSFTYRACCSSNGRFTSIYTTSHKYTRLIYSEKCN